MSAMSDAQAQAIIEQVTGYSVEEKPALALEMAQSIARDITEAIEALGGVPPVVPLNP